MSQEVREDEEDLIVTETPPPSLLPGPLFTSYTWDSDSIDPMLALAANRGEPWMLGVDEAGRGSVCGPQVYGVAFCPKSYEAELLEPGFDGGCAGLLFSSILRSRRLEEAQRDEAEGAARGHVRGVEGPQVGSTRHDAVCTPRKLL